MAGALRKTMVYLGLAEDDERYDGYDESTRTTSRACSTRSRRRRRAAHR